MIALGDDMKNKSTLILGAVFLVLVIIFMITSYKPREVTKGAVPLFEGEKPLIDKIEITNPKKGKVVLENKNSIWYITQPFEYKASNVTVEQTITGLLGIDVDDPAISNREETFDKFDVGDSTGISLKVYGSGNLVLDAVVGKHTVDLTHTYARMAGSSDVALWRGLFARQIDREADDWRDKIIFSFNTDDILSVKVAEGKNVREITLSDSTWVYTENGKRNEIDQAKAKKFVGLIAALSCDTFADENDIPRAAEKQPDTRVSFTVRNGDTHSFDVWSPGEKDNNRYLVREVDGKVLFRFYKYRGEQLVMKYDGIKPDEKT